MKKSLRFTDISGSTWLLTRFQNADVLISWEILQILKTTPEMKMNSNFRCITSARDVEKHAMQKKNCNY